MADLGEDHRGVKAGQGLAISGDAARSPDGGAVLLSADIERGLPDCRPTPGTKVDPVTVHAPIPVQATREPGLGELADIEGAVVGVLPCQRPIRILEPIVQTAASGDDEPRGLVRPRRWSVP